MKKFLPIFVLFCSFAVISCGNDRKDSSKESQEQETVLADDNVETVVEEIPVFSYAVSIYSQAGVFTSEPGSDNKLRWVGSLPKGMEVQIECNSFSKEPNIYELNLAKDKEGTKPSQFAKIKIFGADDEDYYALASNFAVKATTYVVVGDDILSGNDETFMYTEPSITKMSSVQLPAGSLVAVFQNRDFDSDFVEATFYIPEGEYKGLYRNKFLECNSLSNKKLLVQAAMRKDRVKHMDEVPISVYSEIFYDENDDYEEADEAFLNSIMMLGGK